MSEKITIKEIAKKANVSIGTVDRVLHNRGRVAKATKDLVMKIAREGNYASNVYARNLRMNKRYLIAVLLPSDNAYWHQQRKGISHGVEEFENMGFASCELSISYFDETSRLRAIEQALDNEVDGIILSPGLFSPGELALNKLDEHKVPYIFVDSSIEHHNQLCFIGQDAFQSGRTAGQLLNKPYSSDYRVIVVTFSDQDSKNKVIADRIEGLESFFEDKDVEILKFNSSHDHMSISDLKSKLSTSDKPTHVFIPTSRSFLLVNALADLKDQLQLRIVGYDLIEENINFLEQGVIDYIIDQQPIRQGYMATQALCKHLLLRSKVSEVQHVPLNIITKENLMYCEY